MTDHSTFPTQTGKEEHSIAPRGAAGGQEQDNAGGTQEHQAFPAGVTGEAEGAQRSVADSCAGGRWGASHRPCAAPAHAREGSHSRAAGGGGGQSRPTQPWRGGGSRAGPR